MRNIIATLAIAALVAGALLPSGTVAPAAPPDPTQAADADAAARSRDIDSDPPAVPRQSPQLDSGQFMADFVPSGTADSPVDVAVHANRPIAAVHFQADYGAWTRLDPGQSGPFLTTLSGGPWEYWTGGPTPNMGSLVVFRATAADGSVAYSYPFSWAPNGD